MVLQGGEPESGHVAIGTSALLSDSTAVFEHIFDESIQICVWNRETDEILKRYLEDTIRSGAWERRGIVPLQRSRLRAALDRLLNELHPASGRARLLTELSGLIELFATLSDTQEVGVRMAAMQQRMCPRFHTDAVGLRLLCTWIGEGTEWLADEDTVRERPRNHLTRGVVNQRTNATIQRMDSFAVGVLKGESWPGNAGRGVVHRSPQPARWRILLSLDSL